MLLTLFSLSSVLVSGHSWMKDPLPRTGDCPVAGIVMGPNIVDDRAGRGKVQSNDRSFQFDHNPLYNNAACGGITYLDSTKPLGKNHVEICSSKRKKEIYDFSTPAPSKVVKTYTAGQEVTLTIAGSHHRQIVRVAICYEDCMKMSKYAETVLGYWINDSYRDPDNTADRYKEPFFVKVKIPDKNCDWCVLQFLTESDDGRSYVGCADIKITGSQNGPEAVVPVYCNGHPYCNCTKEGSTYGLGGKCPHSTPTFKQSKQLGKTKYCDNCMPEACTETCGGPKDWEKNKPYSPPKLPQYIACSSGNPCIQPPYFSILRGGGAVAPTSVAVAAPTSVAAPSAAPPQGPSPAPPTSKPGSIQVVKAAGKNSCPANSVKLSQVECEQLADAQHDGVIKHNPFVISSGTDPNGCFFFEKWLYFNSQPSQAADPARVVWCKMTSPPTASAPTTDNDVSSGHSTTNSKLIGFF